MSSSRAASFVRRAGPLLLVERDRLLPRLSASSDLVPGSALYVRMFRPGSADSSIISNVRPRSPTTGLTEVLDAARAIREAFRRHHGPSRSAFRHGAQG